MVIDHIYCSGIIGQPGTAFCSRNQLISHLPPPHKLAEVEALKLVISLNQLYRGNLPRRATSVEPKQSIRVQPKKKSMPVSQALNNWPSQHKQTSLSPRRVIGFVGPCQFIMWVVLQSSQEICSVIKLLKQSLKSPKVSKYCSPMRFPPMHDLRVCIKGSGADVKGYV